MEISLVGVNSVKLRGKRAAVTINPLEKNSITNAAIILGKADRSLLKIREDIVTIEGPGEYETGGIKITGIQNGTDTIYSITIDNISILVGKLAEVEKIHQKLQEHNVALLLAESPQDGAFTSGLASNALLFYGQHAPDIAKTLAKDGLKEMNKYQISQDKETTEIETVLLT